MGTESVSSERTPNDWLEPLESFEVTTNSFLVVIRSAPFKSDNPTRAWQGTGEHAQSHDRIYFVEFSRLAEFIAEHSGLAAPPSSSPSALAQRWKKTRLHKILERVTKFYKSGLREFPTVAAVGRTVVEK